jgi:hypothetical protein
VLDEGTIDGWNMEGGGVGSIVGVKLPTGGLADDVSGVTRA